MRLALRRIIALSTLLAAAGCFQYRAAATTPIPAGQSVRLELTDAGRVAVAPMAGEGVDVINGIVETSSPDTVVLRVTSVRRRDVPETWTRERLSVAAGDVRALSVRRFDPVRTVLLVGGLALAGSVVRFGTSDGLFGGRGQPRGSSSGR